MSVVKFGVRHVDVQESFVSEDVEDTVKRILDIAAALVFVLREEFRMADCWEMDDLGDYASNSVISSRDCQRCSLENVEYIILNISVNLLLKLTRLAPALLPATMIFSGLIPSVFAFFLH